MTLDDLGGVDEEVSGRADVEPELEALKRDAHQGRFQIVTFWSLDRLTRKGVKDAIEIVYAFSAAGADFVSFQEPYLNSLCSRIPGAGHRGPGCNEGY